MTPPSGDCPKILWRQKVREEGLRNITNSVIAGNFNVPIRRSGTEIFVIGPESTSAVYFTKNPHEYSREPMTPTGWLTDSE